jgi:hypothetical protein
MVPGARRQAPLQPAKKPSLPQFRANRRKGTRFRTHAALALFFARRRHIDTNREGLTAKPLGFRA